MPDINLLPWREHLQEEKKKAFLETCVLAAVAALCVVLVCHAYLVSLLSAHERAHDVLQQEIVVLGQETEEFDALTKRKSELLNRIRVIQNLQQDRSRVVQMFDTLAHSIPEGLYLRRIIREQDQLTLEGGASSNADISQWMRNVSSSDLFAHVTLREIKAVAGSPDSRLRDQVRFTLDMAQRAWPMSLQGGAG